MGKGRPRKAPMTCEHKHLKVARCSCPGSTTCKKCCDICSQKVVVLPAVTPMKKKVGHREAGRNAMLSIIDQMKELNLNNEEKKEETMPMVREEKEKRGIKDILNYIGEGDSFQYCSKLHDNGRHFIKAFVHAIVHLVSWLITSTIADASFQSEVLTMVIEKLIDRTEIIKDSTHSKNVNIHHHPCVSIDKFLESTGQVQKERDSLRDCLLSIMVNSPRHTLPHRYARLALVRSLSIVHQNAIKIKKLSDNNEVLLLSNAFGRKSREHANKDYHQAIEDKIPLEIAKRSLLRYDIGALEYAIKSILSDSNICLFSWGTRSITVGNTRVDNFPSCARKKLPKQMYIDYVQAKKREKLVSCSRFYDLVNLLTVDNERVVRAVDYVQGILLNDPCTLLQRIIDELISDPANKKKFTRMLEVTRNFLKVQYVSHAEKKDGFCTHGIQYALSKAPNENATESISDKSSSFLEDKTDEIENNSDDAGNGSSACLTCNACKYPHFFADSLCKEIQVETKKKMKDPKYRPIKSLLKERCADAIQVVGDMEEKFALYQSHQVRVKNQQNRINQMKEEMKQKCKETKGKQVIALICIDWKMKWEPFTNRETTTEHYAKRGVSWHGAYILYYKMIDNEVVEKKLYLDQILNGDNEQNGLSVAAMIEAMIVQIGAEVKDITEVWLQSDNAACYHVKHMLFSISLMNMKHKVQITRFIHTETQDGKGLVDAHFARGTWHIKRFVKTKKDNHIKKIVAPQEVARALGWNGGINNSSVMLVEIDRTHLKRMNRFMKGMVSEGNTYFSRMNEIHFKSDIYKEDIDWSNPSNWSKVKSRMKCYPYSNIGNGVEFECDFNKQSFTDLVDNPVKDTARHHGKNRSKVNFYSDDEESVETSDAESEIEDSDEEESESEIEDDLFEEDDLEYIESEERLQNDMMKVKQEGNNELLPLINRSGYNIFNSGNDEESLVTRVSVNEFTSFCERESFKKTGSRVNCQNMQIDEENDMEKNEDNTESEEEKAVRMDMLSRGILMADNLIQSHDIAVVDGQDPNLDYYNEAADFKMPGKYMRKQGWARRDPSQNGTVYGVNYMDDIYKSHIKEWFDEGEVDSCKKQSPREMYLKLVSLFPYKYSVPAETDIRKVIGALVAKKKELLKQADFTESDEESDKSIKKKEKVSRKNVPQKYIDFMEEILEERNDNGSLDSFKPQEALELAKERFKRLPGLSRADNFKAFKSKFSYKKSLEKRKRERIRRRAVADV